MPAAGGQHPLNGKRRQNKTGGADFTSFIDCGEIGLTEFCKATGTSMVEVLYVFCRDVVSGLPVAIGGIDNKIVGHHTSLGTAKY
ncbi:hypothetical protein KCP75_10160 [Salmonella enterica subsp. enterica]|nr:hypothetical protein KCP75_10160 [Salmonella enterica subsp. enterica]